MGTAPFPAFPSPTSHRSLGGVPRARRRGPSPHWPLAYAHTSLMSTLFVKKGREWIESSFLSFNLFFNQIKFLITFDWNEIMPLKSFQMELGK